ncbi:MAG: hydrolase [Bacteroidales bacterium]|jgi:nicotinamidase-related amidase|nr:hydrolase [Bacteroidales bacterium]
MINDKDTGLILIDVQGKLARMVAESETLIANIEKLIKGCQVLGIPIIWLEQYPEGLGKTVPELAKLLTNQSPIEKQFFNALAEKEVKNEIIKLDKSNWLVCGIEAHICVYQTVMALIAKKFYVEVVADCISSRKKSSIDIALNKLREKGAGITNVEMCLYELLKDSKRDAFKKVLAFIK